MKKWSFNRERDNLKISKEKIQWKGPFSLPKYEKETGLNSIPDLSGVYLFCFKYEDGYLIEAAGITKSTKTRISTHVREYKKGNYNILNMNYLERGIREEIWHGWGYAKDNREEFNNKKEIILPAIEKQLQSYRIFLYENNDKRIRERMEASIMINIYTSKESWADISPRWMFLKGRFNCEMPIEITNITSDKIYGLPEKMEI